jgi:hypothetical protein
MAGQSQQVGPPPQSIPLILIGPINYIVLHSNIRTSHSIFLLFKKIEGGKLCTNSTKDSITLPVFALFFEAGLLIALSFFSAVLWIRYILLRIRIRGSVLLTYGSGPGSCFKSCSFRQGPSRYKKNS